MPETNRKHIGTHAEKTRDKKVAQLMDEDDDAHSEDEGESVAEDLHDEGAVSWGSPSRCRPDGEG